MTAREIAMLFAYNSWATNRIFDSLREMPAEMYMKDLKSSHGGIHGTLTHLVAAEKLWLSRWIGKPESALVQAADVPSLGELKVIWEDVASRTARFVGRLNEQKLQSRFQYTSTTGKNCSFTYQQTLQHLVNHSTYHRGQIAALVRQAGEMPVETDLIVFQGLTAQPVRKS